jgi:hypothetical protein
VRAVNAEETIDTKAMNAKMPITHIGKPVE